MQPKSFVAFIGFVVLAAGVYCPILRVFGIIQQTLYQVNKPYALVILLIAVIGIISVVMNRVPAAKIIARLGFVLVVVLYIGAVLKVHSSFSFIPFKSIEQFAVRQIKFTWGWLVLFAGVLLSVLGTSGSRTKKTLAR